MIKVLFKKEIKSSYKALIAFMAILTMYHYIIIDMYDPSKAKTLETLMSSMGGLMKAFGMVPGAKGLLGHISMYLYGFILILFPTIFNILLANQLIGSYLDNGSMAYIISNPHKRSEVIFNQNLVMKLNLFLLFLYTYLITLAFSKKYGDLDNKNFTLLILGCFFLHLFLGSLAMFFNVIYQDARKSIAIMTGLILIMYLFQMASNFSEKFAPLKIFTVLSLFNSTEISKGTGGSFIGPIILLLGSLLLDYITMRVFIRKDYYL